jgi:hypothetical protein
MPEIDRTAYLTGYWKGRESHFLKEAFDESGVRIGTPRFSLQLVLLCIWPKVEELESTTALHAYLASKSGRGFVGELETFQRRCREWGIYKRSSFSASR